MNKEVYRKRLQLLEMILNESIFLLRNNEFPIYNYNYEKFPDEIPLVFQPSQQFISPKDQTILDPTGEIVTIDNYLNRNFSCKLCLDRDRGIRGFLIRGRKKLLILHYTGNSGNQSVFIKKNNKTLFKTKEIQSCFAELTEKSLNTNFEEFFFQEYPGCHFSKDLDPDNWNKRSKICEIQVLETVKKEEIKAILILGSSAILKWDKDFCVQNLGKVMNWKFEDETNIPFMITRSPDALQFLKVKSNERYMEMFQEMGLHLTTLSNSVGGFD